MMSHRFVCLFTLNTSSEFLIVSIDEPIIAEEIEIDVASSYLKKSY